MHDAFTPVVWNQMQLNRNYQKLFNVKALGIVF